MSGTPVIWQFPLFEMETRSSFKICFYICPRYFFMLKDWVKLTYYTLIRPELWSETRNPVGYLLRETWGGPEKAKASTTPSKHEYINLFWTFFKSNKENWSFLLIRNVYSLLIFKIKNLLHAFTSHASEYLGRCMKGILPSDNKTSQPSWEIALCHILFGFRLASDNFRRKKLSCLLVKWLGAVTWS